MSATDTINASSSLVTAGDIIAFLALLVTVVVYIKPKLVYKDAYFPIYREQLDKVYVPMYSLLLPHMYKSIGEIPIKDIIENLLKISNANLSLVNFRLLYLLERHEELTTSVAIQKNFDLICDETCMLFEKCREYLGLDKRPSYYIFRHNQFPSNSSRLKIVGRSIWEIRKTFLRDLLVFALVLFVFLYLIGRIILFVNDSILILPLNP